MIPVMRSASLSLGLVTALIPSSALAESKVEPRLALGLAYYELDVDGAIVVDNSRVSNIKFSDLLYVVGGGLTFAHDRFFIDLYGQYSFDGQDTVNPSIDVGPVTVDNLSQQVDFDRIETSISAGYRFTDQFAAYLGFRYADVNFDGSGASGPRAASLATDFKQRGLFIGAGYLVPRPIFGGNILANAAVTYLDGDIKNQIELAAPLQDVDVDVSGNAIGLNGGLSWIKPISDRVKLVVGADVSQYNFKDDNDQTDFGELIARFRTELRYSFDTAGTFQGN